MLYLDLPESIFQYTLGAITAIFLCSQTTLERIAHTIGSTSFWNALESIFPMNLSSPWGNMGLLRQAIE